MKLKAFNDLSRLSINFKNVYLNTLIYVGWLSDTNVCVSEIRAC